MIGSGAPFGVYVHVPFCAHRCDYCAFATWTDRHHLQHRYLAAVAREAQAAVDAGMPDATTVFFGGGTPSLVEPAALMAVLEAVPLAPGSEVTVECNPDTVTPGLLATYTAHGVNRISLGVQSMVPHVLRALGRTHDPDNVALAVKLVRAAGFSSFNLDLIYGGAGESLGDWRTALEAALALDPPHVSAYALTVEPGTPLADDVARHPDDDDQADKYELADDLLTAAGLGWYEISNWARPGHESRHNRLYWTQDNYVGLGCAAHSHRDGRRWWNVRTPERYLARIEAGEPAVAGEEVLDAGTRRVEGLQLALRTRSGVPAAAFAADELDRLDGLIERHGAQVVLTRAGRLVANDLSTRLR